MILVEKITIEEFRGVRKLTLNFKGKNFAVYGPNGTGKSGIVDALEFALTGNISRLSGKGTGGITLKDHAPHVDSRDNPEKARVTLTLRIPSLKNKQVTIERNVKDTLTPKITPNTSGVLKVLKQLEDHPEFVLSRRELIAYVLAQPGKRSEEIQALLRLDQVGELRSTLKMISNTCNREETTLKKISIQVRDRLAQAMEISELVTDKLLGAVNMRRIVLGLSPIETLTSTTSLHDGLKTGTKATTTSKVNKKQAIADLKRIRELLSKLTTTKTKDECAKLHTQITSLHDDPIVLESVSREKFLRIAITLITENTCPVCDTEWDINTLHSLVETKLKRYEEIAKTRAALEKRIEPIIDLLEEINNELISIENHTKVVAKKQVTHLSSYRSNLISKIKSLKNFLPLTDILSSLANITVVPPDIVTAIDNIEIAVNAIPESTQQEAARDYLILCQDRLETYREAARSAKKAEEHAVLSKTVYDIYVEESNKVLEGVYKQVEEEFSKLYRFINQDDESNFTARLTPSIGKLGFDVDFYGRGHFPPGAYHSEGHQDGMGLCLYLALMQRLQGDNFMFAVLDDVLMSVDTGHRREVCKLFKEYFPNTQFVLTTHDEVWLKHMVSAGLISSTGSKRFSNWTPDHGPTEWNNRDIWAEIDSALKQDDVRTAAGTLRHYLEHIFKEVCDNLRVSVEFKGDGRYVLGDILPPAVKRFRNILAEGKKVAESWGKTRNAKVLEGREKDLSDSFRASSADQWQINPAIHYNEWANLTTADFNPVVNAFRDLIQKFFCDKPECAGLFYITVTSSKTPDTLRCTCRATNINLKKRSANQSSVN
ncbi:AAA family ATPase [Patescibacteria group bacterium AH-259-L07]|nr:AAA family ATPase [Patescibacteria group bacterium AH-259-L07]